MAEKALDDEQRELLGDLIRNAIPVNPAPDIYVTRSEFVSEMKSLKAEMKEDRAEAIDSSETRLEKRFYRGVLLLFLTTFGGFATLMVKLNQIETTASMTGRNGTRLDYVSKWAEASDRRDTRIMAWIKQRDPSFDPGPEVDTPR